MWCTQRCFIYRLGFFFDFVWVRSSSNMRQQSSIAATKSVSTEPYYTFVRKQTYRTVNKYSKPSLGSPEKSAGRLAIGSACLPKDGSSSSELSTSEYLRFADNIMNSCCTNLWTLRALRNGRRQTSGKNNRHAFVR